MNIIDTVIVGGNLPGLSAALILGRARRKILIFDDNNYRNYAVSHVNGFITQDHINPEELRNKARKDLEKYDIKIINAHVYEVIKQENYFIVKYDAFTVRTKTIILATGLKDQLPEIEGLKDAYGKKVWHCFWCDGWENRDKKLGVHGKNGMELCLGLRTWTKDITWFSEEDPSDEDKEKAVNKNIKIVCEKIVKISYSEKYDDFTLWVKRNKIHEPGTTEHKPYKLDGLFLSLTKGQKQKSNLAEKLGLKVTKENGIEVNEKCETEIPGCYAIGDASRDRLLVIIGAAEGVEAAIQVNKYLRENWDE